MYKVRCKEGGRGGSAYVVTLFNVRWGEGVKNGLQLAVVLNTWSLNALWVGFFSSY